MREIFNLKIITPESVPVDCTVTSLIVPSKNGFFGVQKNHVDLIRSVDAGLVSFKEKGEHWKHIFIEAGSISVSKEKSLLIVKGFYFLEKLNPTEIQSELKQLQADAVSDTSKVLGIKTQNKIKTLNNILKSLELLDSRKQNLCN